MRIIAIISAALCLSSCASGEERLCRAEMDRTLLNPETADYSGFEPITDGAISSDEYMSSLRTYVGELIPSNGATYFQMKVRADGELGNKITKMHFCSVNAEKNKCACLAAS